MRPKEVLEEKKKLMEIIYYGLNEIIKSEEFINLQEEMGPNLKSLLHLCQEGMRKTPPEGV